MADRELIHAFTTTGIYAPPYINISRVEDGSVRVIVRGARYANGTGGTEEIIMPESDWRSLVWSVYSETNDYMHKHGRPVPIHGSGP